MKLKLLSLLLLVIITALLVIGCGSREQTNSQLSAESLFQQAELLYRNQDYDKAKEVLVELTQKYPASTQAVKANEMLVDYDGKVAKLKQEEETRQKARKAEEEAKQKAYEESIKPPLQLIEAEVSLNAISNPRAGVIVKNISSKTIDAFTIGIYCYDRFGNEVKHYAYGSNRYGGLSQRTISPGQTTGYNYYWTLHGHENTAKIDVVLEKVHFTDDTTWTPNSGQRISIKGTLDQ